MITVGDLKFTMACSLAMETEHSILYVCKEYNCRLEQYTPMGKGAFGEFGKARQYFYINGEAEEYATIEELVGALNKRKLRIV